MREKPILFSTEMVRAILNGWKTQTRRVIKPQPNGEIKANIPYEFYGSKTERIFTDTKAYLAPYSVGDVLWVRETWRCIKYDSMDGNLSYGVKFKDGEQEHFEFDDNERFHQFGKYAFKNGWQSPYYMPREAARLFLLVKAVRVERLQEITEQDAIAEGALYTDFGTHVPTWKASLDGGKTYHPARPQQHNGWHMSPVNSPDQCYFTATSAFAGYWNRLNAKRGHSWDTSPWVWVIEFSRTEAPS